MSAQRKEKLQNMTPGLRVWLGARALSPMLYTTLPTLEGSKEKP